MTQTHTCEGCGRTEVRPTGTWAEDVRCVHDDSPMRVLDDPEWCECGRAPKTEPYCKRVDGTFELVCTDCFNFWIDLGYLYPE